MIKYLAGGKFGDFIHSLSVVNEKYKQTTQKGIIYLSNKGDHFAYGLETTYNDTKDIILSQDYVDSYQIYNGEDYDVDLTEWRKCDYVSRSYPYTMNHYYSIQWGKHPWITNIPYNTEWEDKIVFFTVHYRFPYSIQWTEFIKEKIVFVSFSKKDYDDFCQRTNLYPQYYKPESLMEFCIILHSCLKVVASYSGILALAFSMHVPCVIGEFGSGELFCKDFEKVLPNIDLKR